MASPDHHISDVETPRRTARRQPAVLGRRDGARAVFRVDRAPRRADGAGLRRGHGAQVVLRLQPPAHRACDRVVQRRRDGDGHADGGHGADQPPLDPQGDERAVPGEGDDVAAGAGRLDPPDFDAITDGVESWCPSASSTAPAPRSSTPTSPCWVTPACTPVRASRRPAQIVLWPEIAISRNLTHSSRRPERALVRLFELVTTRLPSAAATSRLPRHRCAAPASPSPVTRC